MKKKLIFNPEALSKKKSDFLFILTGLLLLFITGYLFYDSVAFLTKSVDIALREDGGANGVFQEFNLEGIEKLGLIKTSPAPSGSPINSPQETPSPRASTTPELFP